MTRKFVAVILAFALISTLICSFTKGPDQSIKAASCTRVAGFGAGFAASSVLGWNKTYGGTSDDEPWALVQTVDGGYALAGSTYSFGAGNGDVWLVETDESGNVMWNKTYGGTSTDVAYSIVQTGDGGYAVAGSTYSYGGGLNDFWLVKTDDNGNALWNKTYGGVSYDSAYSVIQTVDGGYALVGIKYSSGAGNWDVWLVRTDALGNMLWNKTYGGTDNDSARSLVQTGDGGYAITGSTVSFGVGLSDFWLIKTDADGNMQWIKTYGGTDWDDAYSVAQTGDGGYALVGCSFSFGAGAGDVWLVKTDASGNHLWNRTYGGTSEDRAYSMIQMVDGGYALAGYTYSFGAGDSDVWLVEVSAGGDVQWNQTYGGTGEDYARFVVQTSDGCYALAGSTASFGAGNTDFWLVKTARQASTIIVPDDYPTIQQAINNAVDGDSIFVRADMYYENVVVNKSVSLFGEGSSTTIIDGSGIGNVVTINKNSTSITGFTVQNSGWNLGDAGIYLENASLCSISANNISGNFAGIWFEGSYENLIVGNSITANWDDGIVFNYSNNNTVSENNIALHEYFGIVLNWSHNNTISLNNVTQTTGSSHGDGINLWRSEHNHIYQNNVTANTRFGIRLEVQSNYNIVSDNFIRDCSTGLQVYDSSDYNYIYENNVAHCSDGVDVNRYSTQNILSNNTISDNALTGIQVYRAENNQIKQNNIVNNDRGVQLEETVGNIFYHNNIVANTIQVSIIGYAVDTWDDGYPSGGNYWSDYDGLDADGDGIGDTQYDIDVYNVDRYPLMSPWARLLGDINDDGTVDIFDAEMLATAFGSTVGGKNWMAKADLNWDSIIDIYDAIILSLNFRKQRT